MSKRKISVQEIIDIVTNAADSDLSELSKAEECDNNEYEAVLPNNEQSDAVESNGEDSTDEDDNLSLSVITEDKKHVYRWQKRDVPQGNQQYTGEFSPPLVQKKTPLEYFTMFFSQSLLCMIVDTTNLYSVKKKKKKKNTPKLSKQLQRKSRHILACRSSWELSSYHHIGTTGQGLWDILLLQM